MPSLVPHPKTGQLVWDYDLDAVLAAEAEQKPAKKSAQNAEKEPGK